MPNQRTTAGSPPIEALEHRRLLAGDIRGVVWNDLDNDQLMEQGEAGLPNVIVFLDDRKTDGKLGKHEKRTRTDANGNYVFRNVPAGRHFVAVIAPEETTQSWPAQASGFDIDLVFDGQVSGAERRAFIEAAAKWERIILSDLRNLGGHVDDVEIEIKTTSSLLEDNVVATAEHVGIRETDSMLPFQGLIVLNENVLRGASSDFLYGTALHEIAHVLGFGGLWDEKELVGTQGSSTTYSGAHALNQYRTLFDEDASSLPLATGGGDGTDALHWASSFARSGSRIELMRGFLGDQRTITLSTITVGAMRDLGYRVNFRAADPYAGQDATLFRDRNPSEIVRSAKQSRYQINVRDGKTKRFVDFGYTSTAPAEPDDGPPQ